MSKYGLLDYAGFFFFFFTELGQIYLIVLKYTSFVFLFHNIYSPSFVVLNITETMSWNFYSWISQKSMEKYITEAHLHED